jgi:hypothetical protein
MGDAPKDDEPEPIHEQSGRSVPLKKSGEVVVTHHDAPPRFGQYKIHPRRPLPRVPERESEND